MGAKGQPRTGGRTKGTSFAGQLREELARNKVNIVQDFLRDLEVMDDISKRNDQRLKFMEFLYPKARDDGFDISKMTFEEIRQWGMIFLEALKHHRQSDPGTGNSMPTNKEKI